MNILNMKSQKLQVAAVDTRTSPKTNIINAQNILKLGLSMA